MGKKLFGRMVLRFHVEDIDYYRQVLREVAQDLGYTNVRGNPTGQGSISGLLAAIASGEVVVAAMDDLVMAATAEWLHREARRADIPHQVQEGLAALAEALKDALERQERWLRRDIEEYEQV